MPSIAAAARLLVPVLAALCLLGQSAAAQTERREQPPCVPLAKQHPELGTEQSVSARRLFTTVWASFALSGGPCGYRFAAEHYQALLDEARRRGGPTRHTATSLPDWSGHWGTDNATGELAIVGACRRTFRVGSPSTASASTS